jgi:hypothetical protein
MSKIKRVVHYNREILFNKFGQIIFFKRFLYKKVTKYFRHIHNKGS